MKFDKLVDVLPWVLLLYCALIVLAGKVWAHDTVRVVSVSQQSGAHLFRGTGTVLLELGQDIHIQDPSQLIISGFIAVHHRAVNPGLVSVGFTAHIAGPFATREELGPALSCSTCGIPDGYKPLPFMGQGVNIISAKAHLETCPIHFYHELDEPGWYRIVWMGGSQSSQAPDTDGLAELLIENGRGKNILTYMLVLKPEDKG